MNEELRALYEQDQTERQNHPSPGTPEYDELRARDRARMRRVAEIIAAGELQAPEDYFHAALVCQHGESPDDIWQAYELARQGAELGHPRARWLAAAAYDRWLMYQSQPQKYGTQFLPHHPSDTWRLWNVDPTTTDAERASWDVPALAAQRRRAAEMSGPLPPYDLAPQWFKNLDWGNVEEHVGSTT